MNMLVATAAIATAQRLEAKDAGADAELIEVADHLHLLKSEYDAAEAEFELARQRFISLKPARPAELRCNFNHSIGVRTVREHAGEGKVTVWYDPFELNERRDVKILQWAFIGTDHSDDMWDYDAGRPFKEFEHLYESWPVESAQKHLDKAVAALDRHTAEVDAVKASCGFREAEERVNAIYFEKVSPAQERAKELTASTAAGIKAKATILLDWYMEDVVEEEMSYADHLIIQVVRGVLDVAA